ncbi:MAG: methyltransferase domain-containing protein [Polymorphobacter sp.]
MFDEPLQALRRRLVGLRDAVAIRTGVLRRPTPLHREFGWSRGTPIDRHYIEGFLARHQHDIRGEVLEAAVAPNYTQQFGGDRVTRSHILYPVAGAPGTTLVGDLETGAGIPAAAFDAIILTQVFQFIYDLHAAVRHSHAALRPGGVLLATFAGISQISRSDMDNWGEFWRVTDASARRLFGDVFGAGNVEVATFGNVLAASAFLHAMVTSDLTASELDYHDPNYQVIVAVRAVRQS